MRVELGTRVDHDEKDYYIEISTNDFLLFKELNFEITDKIRIFNEEVNEAYQKREEE